MIMFRVLIDLRQPDGDSPLMTHIDSKRDDRDLAEIIKIGSDLIDLGKL